jgi:hypothetical protein
MIFDRPSPGDPDFWEYARGDPDFGYWLQVIDGMCMRFLDQDMLSLPAIDWQDHLEPIECYDRGVTPGMYFLEIIEVLRHENGIDLIDSYIAKQAKWGSICPFMER